MTKKSILQNQFMGTNIKLQRGKYSRVIELKESLGNVLFEKYSETTLNDALIVVSAVYEKTKRNQKDFRKINYRYKQFITPSPRYEIWATLVDDEILQVLVNPDGSTYKTKKASKKYRINPIYNTGKLTQYTVWESYINKPIEKQSLLNLQKIEFNIPPNITVEELVNSFNEIIVEEIERKTKVDYSKKNVEYDDKKVKIPKEYIKDLASFKIWLKKFHEDKVIEKKEWDIKLIKKIMDFSFSFPKRNKTNFRLDHILTSLPSKYFKYIKLDGEGIVEFDLKNAQYCFLANLIDNPSNSIFVKHMDIKPICSYCKEQYNNDLLFIKSPIYLFKDFKNSPDVQFFVNACFNGTLYDDLAKELKLKNREAVKRLLMCIAFGKAIDRERDYIEMKFKNMFPKVYELFSGLKHYYSFVFSMTDDANLLRLRYTGNRIKNKFDAGNNYFPIGLQRIESEIFIDNILNELFKNSIIALSKHDSIICKKSDADMVYSKITEVLDRILGEKKYSIRVKDHTKEKTKKLQAA